MGLFSMFGRSGRTRRLFDAIANENDGESLRLIEDGIDLDFRNDEGDCALLWAANFGRKDVVEALLKAGADPNSKNDVGLSALQFAAQAGDVRMTKALLDKGADPNKRTKRANGTETAPILALAAMRGQEMIVRLLLKAGADPRATHLGKTAREHARLTGNQSIADIIGMTEAMAEA